MSIEELNEDGRAVFVASVGGKTGPRRQSREAAEFDRYCMRNGVMDRDDCSAESMGPDPVSGWSSGRGRCSQCGLLVHLTARGVLAKHLPTPRYYDDTTATLAKGGRRPRCPGSGT